jgi:hypothetical protein
MEDCLRRVVVWSSDASFDINMTYRRSVVLLVDLLSGDYLLGILAFSSRNQTKPERR